MRNTNRCSIHRATTGGSIAAASAMEACFGQPRTNERCLWIGRCHWNCRRKPSRSYRDSLVSSTKLSMSIRCPRLPSTKRSKGFMLVKTCACHETGRLTPFSRTDITSHIRCTQPKIMKERRIHPPRTQACYALIEPQHRDCKKMLRAPTKQNTAALAGNTIRLTPDPNGTFFYSDTGLWISASRGGLSYRPGAQTEPRVRARSCMSRTILEFI